MLLVEHEFLVGMELHATLDGAGFDVLGPIASLTGALEALGKEPPDAAVLDVNIRGGWVTPVAAVLADLMVPFVLVSGYGPDDLAEEPLLATALNLGKPFSPRALIDTMRTYQAQAVGRRLSGG